MVCHSLGAHYCAENAIIQPIYNPTPFMVVKQPNQAPKSAMRAMANRPLNVFQRPGLWWIG